MAYEAVVIKIDDENKAEHQTADALELYRYNGNQIIIKKGMYNHGDLCLYFIPDTQISDWFLREHKLYRKNPDNPDEKWTGFFEPNGRVKILKLRKEYSNGFLFKLDPSTTLREGELISSLDGKPLCDKYYTPEEIKYIKAVKNKPKKKFSLSNIFAPKIIGVSQIAQHIDTPQLVHAINNFQAGDLITITKKLHGTSGRTGKIILTAQVNFWNKLYWQNSGKLFNRVVKIHVEQTGSRRRIVRDSYLHEDVPQGYYGKEQWRVDIHNDLIKYLNPNQTIYYEIVGNLPNGKSIMQPHGNYKYSYGCGPTEYNIYIYRLTFTKNDGTVYEYSYEDLCSFCAAYNLNVVPMVARFVYNGNAKEIARFVKTYCNEHPYEYDGLLEGLVVRNDNEYKCCFAKYKSDLFSEAEDIAKQSEKFADLETMS